MEKTPLVNCGPGPFFYIYYTIYCKLYSLLFTTNKHLLPHYTSNPLFQTDRWDWQPHCTVGAEYLGCVVWRFHIIADTSGRLANVSAITFGSDFFLLLVRLNLGFVLRENLLLYSSTLLLGLPNKSCDEGRNSYQSRCSSKRSSTM